MGRKSIEEKRQEIELKIEQLQNQKKALLARERKAQRDARTHRLVQLGALAEKYFGCEGIEPADFEVLLKQIGATSGYQRIALDRKATAQKAVADEQNGAAQPSVPPASDPVKEPVPELAKEQARHDHSPAATVMVRNSFAVKEQLKQRGYSWDGNSKAWMKSIPAVEVQQEKSDLMKMGVADHDVSIGQNQAIK